MGGAPRLLALAVSVAACGATPVEQPPEVASPPVETRLTAAPAPTSAAADPTSPPPTNSSALVTTVESPPRSVALRAIVPASPPAPAIRSLSLAFTGDTLPHSPLWRQAERNAGGVGFDFGPMLAPLGSIISAADLSVCHLETPIAPAGEEYSTMPRYGVPAEIAAALAAAGYDRCSTASNHTADRGAAGIDRTVDVLESVGITQSGMARTPEEIAPRVFEVAGIRVSHLSYTFSFNGLSLPDGEEWRSATIEPERIIADASAARTLGAEFVIVSLHWGSEGRSEVTVEQRRDAEAITASGAVDLVVGHHAHVVQPIEQINGVWVLFGLGNILSNLPTSERWPASSQDGAVATMTVTIDEAGGVIVSRPAVHPTWVDKQDGWVVRPVLEGLADPTTSKRLVAALEDSLERTSRIVGDHLVGVATD